MKDIKIALVGSGMIGGGLAVNALMNDYPTIIYDVIDLNKVRATIQNVSSDHGRRRCDNQKKKEKKYWRMHVIPMIWKKL